MMLAGACWDVRSVLEDLIPWQSLQCLCMPLLKTYDASTLNICMAYIILIRILDENLKIHQE